MNKKQSVATKRTTRKQRSPDEPISAIDAALAAAADQTDAPEPAPAPARARVRARALRDDAPDDARPATDEPPSAHAVQLALSDADPAFDAPAKPLTPSADPAPSGLGGGADVDTAPSHPGDSDLLGHSHGSATWPFTLGAIQLASAWGGGGPTATTKLVIPYEIRGSISLGPIIGGNGLTVTLYDKNGNQLGASAVGDDGTYVILIKNGYVGAVVALVTDSGTGGDYIDEATRSARSLDSDVLRGVTVVDGKTDQVLNVNLLIHLAN